VFRGNDPDRKSVPAKIPSTTEARWLGAVVETAVDDVMLSVDRLFLYTEPCRHHRRPSSRLPR
jgi:hypothetical protein